MIAVRLSHRNYRLVTHLIPYATWLSKLKAPKKDDIKIYANIKLQTKNYRQLKDAEKNSLPPGKSPLIDYPMQVVNIYPEIINIQEAQHCTFILMYLYINVTIIIEEKKAMNQREINTDTCKGLGEKKEGKR